MKLRDLTDDEIGALQADCDTMFTQFTATRSLSSRGPKEYYRAGYNAALTNGKVVVVRKSIEAKEPMTE
jgi:hypothetical protein